MLFRQLFDAESSTYTYLLADAPGADAVLIDPVADRVEHYLGLLSQLRLKLVLAIDTHIHADHITALGPLRERTGCVTGMGAQAANTCASMHFADGETLSVGGVHLKAIYTPGHTDDSYCFLMDDRIFTGDTLLIRGTGRTDFQNGDPGAAYDSLFEKVLTLPDETLVYPGHDYNGMTVSTIGEEKAFNPRLQTGSREDYIQLMNGLDLEDPKMMDVAVPANRACGLLTDED